MRHVFKLCTAMVCTALFGLTLAQADSFPVRPITLVVPFAPGGGTDSIARDMAKALAESGYKDFDISTWWGLLAPAKTPQAVVQKLNQAINEVAAHEPVRTRLMHEGAEAISGSPEAFARTLSHELVQWRAVAKAAGLSADKP